jgi:hypothetical protein
VIRAVLAAGHAAPSILNTQPWQFAVSTDVIELYADRHRQLQHIDPLGREQVISCGAAILNMRVAAAALGHPMRVRLLPEPGSPQHLATLTLEPHTVGPLPLAGLAEAIHNRHGRSFDTWPVGGDLMTRLHEAATAEGARLHLIGPQRRRSMARLVSSANAAFAADLRYEADLQAQQWPSRRTRDGISTARIPAAREPGGQYLAEQWVAVTTTSDDLVTWLAAGQATERVVLTATTMGIGTSFMTQPLEVPLLRADCGALLGPGVRPQVLLRLAPTSSTTGPARRPLDEVVITTDNLGRP